MKSLSNRNSTGSDGIPMEALKEAVEESISAALGLTGLKKIWKDRYSNHITMPNSQCVNCPR